MKKNVLIIGFGFLGTNIAESLRREYNIIVFSKDIFSVQGEYKTYQGDFTKKDDLEMVFKHNTIDLVVHALSTTIPSNNDATFDVRSNLLGTIQLLDFMKYYNVPKIVFLSSGGTIYGRIHNDLPVKESYETDPVCSYGITKLAIEKYIALYHFLYHIDYLILRISNPYGEFHVSDEQGFINVSLKKLIRKEKIIVWGNGDVVRDYIYIKDCSSMIHELIKNNISNQILNIGSGHGYSLNEILAVIQNTVGKCTVEYKPARNFDIPRIVLDTQKLRSHIDVKLTPLAEGIRHTYEWLKRQA